MTGRAGDIVAYGEQLLEWVQFSWACVCAVQLSECACMCWCGGLVWQETHLFADKSTHTCMYGTHVIHTSLLQYTHTEAVLSCSYCTEITCKHLGYVHKAGTCVAIWWQPSPSLLLPSNAPFLAWLEARGSASGKGYRMTGILHSSRRLHISLYELIYFLCSCN